MPKISVIVPVYQGERFIESGLDALYAQTLRDIEIVCVNDGSTDSSGELLAAHAAKDSRVKLVNTANRGLSAARNTGIDTASGEYLMFMDVDDKLLPTACERVSTVFEQTAADIVTFGAVCDPPDAATPWLQECLSPRDASYPSFDARLLFNENARPYACRTAVSADFLKRCGLRFEEGIAYGEDQVFHFMAYPASRRTELVSDKLYSYRLQVESSLTATRSQDTALRIGEHIHLAGLILAGWQEQGWLEQYKAIMLSWALEFVTLDLFRLGKRRLNHSAPSSGQSAPALPRQIPPLPQVGAASARTDLGQIDSESGTEAFIGTSLETVDGVRLLEQLRGLLERYFAASQPGSSGGSDDPNAVASQPDAAASPAGDGGAAGAGRADAAASPAGAAGAGRPNSPDAVPPKLPFWTRRLLQQICRKQPQQLMAQKPWPTIIAFYLQQRGIAKSLSRLLAGGLRSR